VSEIAQELNSRPSGLGSDSWQPILDGALAERAFEAILAVAASLRGHSLDTIEHPTLAGGDSGLALLYAYLDAAQLGERYDHTALMFLRRAITGLSGSPMAPSLYAGFTGIAWTVEHLKGRLLVPGVIAFLGQVSAAAFSNTPPALSIQSTGKARTLLGGAVQSLVSIPKGEQHGEEKGDCRRESGERRACQSWQVAAEQGNGEEPVRG